jgi:hypothetical protein
MKAVHHFIASSDETMGAFSTGVDTANLHRPTLPVSRLRAASALSSSPIATAFSSQGLTLVHFSAQPKPFLVTEATANVHFSAQPKPFLVTEATASVHFSAQPQTFLPMRPVNIAHKKCSRQAKKWTSVVHKKCLR